MREPVVFVVEPLDKGARLDQMLAERLPDISRALARRLVDEGRTRVNGRPVKAAYRVQAGDRVEVALVLPPSLDAEPEDIPLNVVYEDGDLAVIDKPAGLVVHPAAGHPRGTLANALLARFPGIAGVGDDVARPGIVHRLDKDTSGLLVVALNPGAQQSLQHQLATRTLDRRYLALAWGRVEPPAAAIRAPVGRDPRNRRLMAVYGTAARPAETSYRVLEYLTSTSLVEARLHTGRTHQIRVHFQALGHPLVGDHTYGGPSVEGVERQFLHAYRLTLRSPSRPEVLDFQSNLPGDLQSALDRLRVVTNEEEMR